MIVRIGWRVIDLVFALNCRHMQAVVQEIQVVEKTRSRPIAKDCQVNVGCNSVSEATKNL